MSRIQTLVSLFFIHCLLIFSTTNLVACYGSINVCGDLGDYICEANENCEAGSTVTFTDVCHGYMFIEYEVGSMECP